MKKAKTARFAELVKQSGRPEMVVLWTKPEENRELMRAVAENRVLTVNQPNVGTRKDFGVVGFSPGRNASYLEFPRELAVEGGTKVVGIRYEEVQQSKPAGPLHKPKEQARPGIPMKERASGVREEKNAAERKKPVTKGSGKEPKTPPKKKEKTFIATATWTATVSEEIEVEAGNASIAKRLIGEEVNRMRPDFSAGKVSISVQKPKQK